VHRITSLNRVYWTAVDICHCYEKRTCYPLP